jgi:hypothetical protein
MGTQLIGGSWTLPINEIRVGNWLFKRPRKTTRAITAACAFGISYALVIERDFIVRRNAPVANTFIHERIHTWAEAPTRCFKTATTINEITQ